jgi:hypothetical protein
MPNGEEDRGKGSRDGREVIISAMAWKREKFTAATDDGTEKSVSGLTSSGIGLHRSSDKRDNFGHYRWIVTHLNTGLPFLHLNVRGSSAATYFGNLIVDDSDWAGVAKPEDFAEKYQEMIARLHGIEQKLGGSWIEFPDQDVNDRSKRSSWRSGNDRVDAEEVPAIEDLHWTDAPGGRPAVVGSAASPHA